MPRRIYILDLGVKRGIFDLLLVRTQRTSVHDEEAYLLESKVVDF
jgi:hypothetical protein